MGAYNDIYVELVFSSETVAASADSTSSALDLGNRTQSGFFSLQYYITGDGTARFEYLLSNDGVNYTEPSTATDIASSIVKTSGPAANGRDVVSFEPELGRWMKIKVTETGGVSAIVVTAHVAMT